MMWMINWMSKLMTRLTKKKKNMDITWTQCPSRFKLTDYPCDIFYPSSSNMSGLTEDSMILINNHRDPIKRVYKIEVGAISPEEVEDYINKLAERFKKHATNDTSSEGSVL